MPPVRDHNAPRTKANLTKSAGVTKRSHLENKERAYVAASRRSDRSLEARLESAHQASNIHFERTGRRLIITADIVEREEMYEEEDQSHQLRMMRAGAYQHRNLDNNILDLLQQSALARAQTQWMSNPAFQHMTHPTLQMYQMNQAQAQFQGNALQSPGGFTQTNMLGFTQNAAFNQQSQPSQTQGFQLDKAFAFNAQQQVSSPQAQMVSPQQMQRTPSAQQQQSPQTLQDFQQQAQFTGLSSFINFDGPQTPQPNATLSPQSAAAELQQHQKQHELFLQQQLEARRQAYMHLAQQQQKQLEQQALNQQAPEQQIQELPKQEEQHCPDPLLANLKSEPTEIDEPVPFTKPQQLSISASQDKLVEVQPEQLRNAPYESPLFSNLNLLEFDTDESLLPDDAVKALLDEYDWSHQDFGTVDTYS